MGISERPALSASNIRRASAADIDQLGVIGPAAYALAYAYLWADGAAFARHLATFSAEAFGKFLKRADTRLWVAEIDGSIVGFLSMIVGSANPITGWPNGAEIPRIYLLPGAQKLGLGRRLLEAAIGQAREEKLGHVWLDVMASAQHARRAYRLWGFSEIGTTSFGKPVRSELAEMVVLIKRIEGGADS
jgi:diamine N-acetyltransferase